MSAQFQGQNFSINIMNVYAPYRNREPFWKKLFESEIFDIDNILIAGDLNFTLNLDEVWGTR